MTTAVVRGIAPAAIPPTADARKPERSMVSSRTRPTSAAASERRTVSLASTYTLEVPPCAS